MHGAINPRHLLKAELDQRSETGFEVTHIAGRISALGGIDELSDTSALELINELEQTSHAVPWGYIEPDDLDSIHNEAGVQPAPTDVPIDSAFASSVERAWLGRVVGNMLGKPVEGWSHERIKNLLESHAAWPLQDYFPEPNANDEYLECWVDTVQGRIDGSSRDDDVDYTILNLHVLRGCGPDFTTGNIATAWLALLPFLQTFTAERVAIRNIVEGRPLSEVGRHRNPYREYIGAAIRADVFGYVNPGDPAAAADMAFRDASLSHTASGIYGEMWCAALIAAAFDSPSAQVAIDRSISVIPRRSRLYEAIERVRSSYQAGLDWEECRQEIQEHYGEISWVHTIPNLAIVAAGVLYGNGDFDSTIGLTVSAGLDTDSNGATAGSVAALLAPAIDKKWSSPLRDYVRSAVFGYDGSSISGFARSTTEVALRIRSGDSTPAEPYSDYPHPMW